MTVQPPSLEETARRGEELFESSIRASVTDEDDGKIIVIDIATGEYEIADSMLPAADRLKARRPEALLYTRRIGHDAVYDFANGPQRVKR